MFRHEKSVLYWPKGLFLWRRAAKYAEGHLVEGKRHGKWMFWYKSGQSTLLVPEGLTEQLKHRNSINP